MVPVGQRSVPAPRWQQFRVSGFGTKGLGLRVAETFRARGECLKGALGRKAPMTLSVSMLCKMSLGFRGSALRVQGTQGVPSTCIVQGMFFCHSGACIHDMSCCKSS